MCFWPAKTISVSLRVSCPVLWEGKGKCAPYCLYLSPTPIIFPPPIFDKTSRFLWYSFLLRMNTHASPLPPIDQNASASPECRQPQWVIEVSIMAPTSCFPLHCWAPKVKPDGPMMKPWTVKAWKKKPQKGFTPRWWGWQDSVWLHYASQNRLCVWPYVRC